MESSSGKEVPVDHLCLALSDVEGSTIGVVLHFAGDLTEEGCAADHYFLLLFGNGRNVDQA